MPIPRIEREVSRLEAEMPQTVTQLRFVPHRSGSPFGLLGDELVLNSCASARTSLLAVAGLVRDYVFLERLALNHRFVKTTQGDHIFDLAAGDLQSI